MFCFRLLANSWLAFECFHFYQTNTTWVITWQGRMIFDSAWIESIIIYTMSLSLSQAIICLFLVICTFYQANGQDISIIRGKKDIFTNISGCQNSKAVCYRGSGENCTYCQCKNEMTTFIQRSNGYDECIPNERLANTTCKWPKSMYNSINTNALCSRNSSQSRDITELSWVLDRLYIVLLE